MLAKQGTRAPLPLSSPPFPGERSPLLRHCRCRRHRPRRSRRSRRPRAANGRCVRPSLARSVSETEISPRIARRRRRTPLERSKDSYTGETDGPLSSPLSPLRAIFTQPGVGAGRALRTDGQTEGRARDGQAIPISASPERADERGILPPLFHSALLHNSNVEGTIGRADATDPSTPDFPETAFVSRSKIDQGRRRKTSESWFGVWSVTVKSTWPCSKLRHGRSE